MQEPQPEQTKDMVAEKREGGWLADDSKIMKKSRGKKKGDFISRLLFISSQSNLFVRNN